MAFAGLAMVVFGIKDSVIIMGIAGFIFFLMLTFGRGAGITIMAAGILLSVVAAITYTIKSVRRLE